MLTGSTSRPAPSRTSQGNTGAGPQATAPIRGSRARPCGSRIDYQRRRDLIAPETITMNRWQELCLAAAAHPGEARRHKDA